MASTQFAATAYASYKSDSQYTTLYSGFYGVNTTSYSKYTHAYRGMIFFNASAITSTLYGKVVDSIALTFTPLVATRYNSTATLYFWRTNLTAMPAGGTNILAGLETTKTGGANFLEELTPMAISESGGAQTGAIASGDAAIRLAEALKAGCGLGSLDWYAANGGTVYCPSAGLNHAGSTTAPVLTITYHDAGSIRVKVNGVWKLGIPYVKVGGVWKQGMGYVNAGGAWKQGIS